MSKINAFLRVLNQKVKTRFFNGFSIDGQPLHDCEHLIFPTLFIEVPVPSRKVCNHVYMLTVSIFVSLCIFLLNFRTILTVVYYLFHFVPL